MARSKSTEFFSEVVPTLSFDSTSKEVGVYPDIQGDDVSLLSNQFMKQEFDPENSDATTSVHLENSPSLTIFLLINTMIGSGILNQPFVFADAGAFGGVVGYIIASTFTWLGLNLLTNAGLKTNIYEYGTLTKSALGRKGEILIDVAIIVGCFGALLGYIVVVGSTLSQLLSSWGCESGACGIYLTTIISVAIFVTPICLFRHFGHLALLSLFSVFAILCVLFLVIIGGPLLASSGNITVFNLVGTIKSFGSIVFSLSCGAANFQAFITTKKASRNRTSWMYITAAVITIGSLMCVAMGIAGYVSFKSDTEGIILDNFNGHQFDFFKIMVAAHLILYVRFCINVFHPSLFFFVSDSC